jgi:hypothetical protein
MDKLTLDLLERMRRFAMPDGPVRCTKTWLRQVGEIRFAPDDPWKQFEAEETFDASGVNFRWNARMQMARIVPAKIRDGFAEGRGFLTARWLGIVTLARFRGPDVDRGEAMRGLAEQPWRPPPFAEVANVSWQATPAEALSATFDDGRTRVSVEFELNEENRTLAGRALNRPRIVGKETIPTPWAGMFSEYRMFDGLFVPTQAEVAWFLPEGSFTYWRCSVTDFRVVG